MEYNTLLTLRQKHPAWRLLVADHAPLIISFLFKTFIAPNIRTMGQPDIISRLDDHLYSIRCGQRRFPAQRGSLPRHVGFRRAWLAAQVLPTGQRRTSL